MKPTRIFLASSSELEQERRDFEILIGRLNKLYVPKGIMFQVDLWEDFTDAVSKTRLQDEYDRAINTGEIFVMLFFTKVGKYTAEEFETAFGSFKENDRPIVYTYFKNAPVRLGDLRKDDVLSMFNFKEKLNELGHFYTVYTDTHDLHLQFTNQLAKLTDSGKIHEIMLRLEPALHKAIDAELNFCKQSNIYFYTNFIFKALLEIKGSFTRECLNSVRRGYPELYMQGMQEFIAASGNNNSDIRPFDNQHISTRKEFIEAARIADQAKSENIRQEHLLLALIPGESATIRTLKRDLGEKWDEFVRCAHKSRLPPTPRF
jgi:hypothetical protein